jgi:hypothetical protein
LERIFYIFVYSELQNILKNKENTYLFKCNDKGYKWEGMFWKFYPLEDNNIDYFLSRDSDSRITKREMDLVNEWIISKKCFHIIRDYPYHAIEILGGTFGVDVKKFRNIVINHNFKNIDLHIIIFFINQ